LYLFKNELSTTIFASPIALNLNKTALDNISLFTELEKH